MIYFEPRNLITNKEEFTNELLLYKAKEKNDLFILEESMTPLVELNGQTYRCYIESPKGGPLSDLAFSMHKPLIGDAIQLIKLVPVEKSF